MLEIFEMGADLVNSVPTRGAMDKWRLHMDSVHQRGLDTTLEEVLTLVQSGGGGVDKNAWNLRKSAPASSLIAEPEKIWTNGD